MSSTGRVVVVTGGTRGIGLGLAREFVARGCRVVICGRSRSSVEQGLTALDAGANATGIATDVTDRASVQALWDHAVDTFGRVDVWINNAGISTERVPLLATDMEKLDKVFATNVNGVVNGAAVAGRGMTSQPGGGWIWNMEGLGSNGQIQPGIAVYGASKRAVNYLTEALVKETKATDVKIGFLSPGIVVTDLLVGDYGNDPEGFAKAKKIFNILGDKVETVTPFLADGVLKSSKSGARVAWLTGPKAAKRFMTAGFTKRDLFQDT